MPESVWCKPRNCCSSAHPQPDGAVMPLTEWEKLFALSDRYGFVIASDECYSRNLLPGRAPLGGLEAAAKPGRSDYRWLIAFTSPSKRSNVPGLRSGFVAGDAALIQSFLLYRTLPVAPWALRFRVGASLPGTMKPTWRKTARCTERSSPRSRPCCRR